MEENQETLQSAAAVKKKRRRLYEPLSNETIEIAVPSETTESVTSQQESKKITANEIIVDYVLLSTATALVPVPFLDMVAVTAIQLRMLKRLSDLYRIAFSEQRGKMLIASLIGGFHAGLFTGSLIKFIPVVGILGAMIPIAALAGALTYAVGQVFIRHFETGGTLLDFDPAKMKTYFVKQYKEGKKVASTLNSSDDKSSS